MNAVFLHFGGSQSFGREFGEMEKVDEEDRRILNVER